MSRWTARRTVLANVTRVVADIADAAAADELMDSSEPYLCLLTESIQTSWICLCVLKLTPTFHLYMPSTVVVVSW